MAKQHIPQQYQQVCPTPVRVSPLGQQMGKAPRLFAIPFAFNMQGGEYSTPIRLPVSYDFRLEIINSYYEREYYLQIRDDFRTEDLFYEPVRGSLITGEGRFPFIPPEPYIFEAGTTITVSVVDTDPTATTPARVEVVLIGEKLLRG